VITNLLTVAPLVGASLVEILWGGYTVGGATLTRFFTLHYLRTLGIGVLIVRHILLLHNKGSSNPLGVDRRNRGVSFHPYCTRIDAVIA